MRKWLYQPLSHLIIKLTILNVNIKCEKKYNKLSWSRSMFLSITSNIIFKYRALVRKNRENTDIQIKLAKPVYN